MASAEDVIRKKQVSEIRKKLRPLTPGLETHSNPLFPLVHLVRAVAEIAPGRELTPEETERARRAMFGNDDS